MRRHARLLCLTLLTLSIPSGAWADSISYFSGFSLASNPAFDDFLVHPFDPSLGELDQVFVGISGGITMSSTTAVLPAGSGFVPFAYEVDVVNDFFGLFGNLFDFEPEATFRFAGTASGSGETVVQTRSFTYGFTLTSGTDLSGVVPVNSSGVELPPFVAATRSDFLPTLAGEYVVETRFAPSYVAGLPAPVDVSGGGILEVRYTYTPPAPVPEPRSLVLFGCGLVALSAAGVGRRASV